MRTDDYIKIPDITAFEGEIPLGYDLVVTDDHDLNTALVLYDFSELGLFDDHFVRPQYGFLKHNHENNNV